MSNPEWDNYHKTNESALAAEVEQYKEAFSNIREYLGDIAPGQERLDDAVMVAMEKLRQAETAAETLGEALNIALDAMQRVRTEDVYLMQQAIARIKAVMSSPKNKQS